MNLDKYRNIPKEINLDKREVLLDELKDLLDRSSSAYYNTDTKVIGDLDFDDLKDIYEMYRDELEVGADPAEGKGTINVNHAFAHLVGSLRKVNTIEQLKEWIRSVMKGSYIKLLLSLKYDGNSVVGEYLNGSLVSMLTRGKNGKGLDLTHVFKGHKVPITEHVGIKYEVVITYEDFRRLIEVTGKSYANPRSMVAGKLGDDDAIEYAEYFTLVPLGMSIEGRDISKDEELELMNTCFPDAKVEFGETATVIEGTLDEVVAEVNRIYKWYGENRSDLDFMIDGLVIDLFEDKYKALGIVSNKPKWMVAFKFPYMEAESEVVRFDFTLGRTGRITPRVWFKPVEFNGAVQQKVSLANYDRYVSLGLGIGSKVLVQYRNDTLSYVERLNVPENDNITPYPFTSACPVCSGSVQITESGAFAECGNELCQGKLVGRIERYLVKLDVKGIKASTIEKLVEAGLVNDIPDLYTMDYAKIEFIEGLGKSTSQSIKKAIQNKVSYDYEILAGIGIKDFGSTNAKVLCMNMSFYDIMSEYSEPSFRSRVMQLEGFSDIKTDKLIDGMDKFYDTLSELYSLIDFKEISKEDTGVKDEITYKFCATGSFESWSNRKEITKFLEDRGHKVSGSVSKNTDYLINNDIDSVSGKNKDAKELDVPIIDEQALKALLNI